MLQDTFADLQNQWLRERAKPVLSVVNNSTGAYGTWANPPWGETVTASSPYCIKKTAKRSAEFRVEINKTPRL